MLSSRTVIFSLCVISVVLLDQLTKYWASTSIGFGQSVEVIPRMLYLTLTYNTGIAFGMLRGAQWLITPVSILVIGGAVVLYAYSHDRWSAACFGLLIGGAIANLFDRIAHGHVIDFIDVRLIPVFNIADSAITVAVILLAARSVFFAPKRPEPESAVE